MVKTINTVSDPVQYSRLKTSCAEAVLGDALRAFIQDLKDTADAHPNCAGLTSNQIWEDDVNPAPSVFVVRSIGHSWITFINPVVEKVWNKEIKESEGCMSIPGRTFKVTRPKHINVSYTDENGERQNTDLFEMAARVFLQEYDHTQGVLING